MTQVAARAAPIETTKPFDPLRWTTRLVLGVLVLAIALDFVAIVADLSYHSLVEHGSNGGGLSLAQIQSADDRHSTIGWAQTCLYFIAAIFFIIWFSRAYKNLRRLGVEGLRWREGWAIGAWFVPLLNFVRPKAIANDIWRGSDPQRPPRTYLPEDTSVPWYFNVWWSLFVVNVIFSRIAIRQYQNAGTLAKLSSATLLLAASDALDVIDAVFAVAVVYQTVNRQRTRARVLADRPSEDVLVS